MKQRVSSLSRSAAKRAVPRASDLNDQPGRNSYVERSSRGLRSEMSLDRSPVAVLMHC